MDNVVRFVLEVRYELGGGVSVEFQIFCKLMTVGREHSR